jgi:hypothetical protein
VASDGTQRWPGAWWRAPECGADRLGGIGGPLGDRGHGASAGQHRGGGHGQDGEERGRRPARGSWVADRGERGQQVGRFGVLERLGVGEVGQGGWDRG